MPGLRCVLRRVHPQVGSTNCTAVTNRTCPTGVQVSGFGILDCAREAKMGCELAPKEAPEGLELGTFAGGCFWGLELAMQRVPGVVTTSSGYTQGDTPNPNYEMVCSGRSGHTEAVQVSFPFSATCPLSEQNELLAGVVSFSSHIVRHILRYSDTNSLGITTYCSQ